MSLPASLSAAILDTVLGRLALLFLAAASDPAAARQAATQLLAAYDPKTDEELTLAAEIISFRLHTLEALSYASEPGLSLNKILRLRGSAVSLSRESNKAQRKLDQLQKARTLTKPQAATAQTPAPQPPAPQTKVLAEAARQTMPAPAKCHGQTWTQSYQQRQTAKRIAANLKKNQAPQPALTRTAAATPYDVTLAS